MSLKKIRSLTNPRIKEIVRLKTRRERVRRDLSIIEGLREISMALNAGLNFREYYVDTSKFHDDGLLRTILSFDNPTFDVTTPIFDKISHGERNEGILAVFETPHKELEDLPRKNTGLYVIVEGVEKPGNLGAILRTCDGTAVDGVIICEARTDVYNPNVIRASLGTVFTLNVVETNNEDADKFLKKHNVKVIAAKPNAKQLYTSMDYHGSVALVVGSEDKGVGHFWDDNAHEHVRIPMRGKSDSLNVSTSTAIILYEILRQRSI